MARVWYLRLIVTLIMAMVITTAGCEYVIPSRRSTDRIRNSVVRVVTRNGTGTGFFVKGPDGHVYVATAFHVIENGGMLTLLRYVDIGKNEHFVEAYLEVEIVAYDREADLAILRARNVPDKKMPALALAEPQLDEPLRSYGFPASSLVGSLGLTAKDGKVLGFAKLSFVDRRTHTYLKREVTPAIIVSSALEPGFSGGPSVNSRGEVIGVNVQKDVAFQAQNAGVRSSVLRTLLARIKPHSEPTVHDVAEVTEQLQTDVLRVSVGERTKLHESTMLSLSELEPLRKYADELWWSTESVRLRLSLSLLPGKTLETSDSPEVIETIARCREEHSPVKAGNREVDVASACGEHTLRALAWDLLAMTLHWEGRQRRYTVSSLDIVDPALHHYVAKIAIADGSDTFFSLPLVLEGGRLKVRLFQEGRLIAMSSGSKWTAHDYTGAWSMAPHPSERERRKPEPAGTRFSIAEKLNITIRPDGTANIRHDITSDVIAPDGFAWCNAQSKIAVAQQQQLVGSYANGALRTLNREYDATKGQLTCESRCGHCGVYTPDMFAFFKRLGDQLVMYRTDGSHVEQQVFYRNPG